MRDRSVSIYAALAANVAIAITKFVAAALGDSTAMLAEALHSVVDTGDGRRVEPQIARRCRPRPPCPVPRGEPRTRAPRHTRHRRAAACAPAVLER